MGRKFNVPSYYKSKVISAIKALRNTSDQRKKDLAPTLLDFGKVQFKIARHFGFCFGVENAIEIAYRAVEENPGRRVFLLSEVIHNPHVNGDLISRGVRFILSYDGKQLVPFEELTEQDIVIIPAFGTSIELVDRLSALGINPFLYNATCPFVEKVWKKANQIGEKGYSVIVHGKHAHEETKATFSHAKVSAPTLIIRDMEEAKRLVEYIQKRRSPLDFASDFAGRYSPGFDVTKDLDRIGVVNQTTMLATETQAISSVLREAMIELFGNEEISLHFADTRDTLCYATLDNQNAVHGLIESGGDLAIVVGGYQSSNTSHLVEICEEHLPTFFIKDSEEILDRNEIRHLDFHRNQLVVTQSWLPFDKDSVTILITAGASCPDAIVESVLLRILEFFGLEADIDNTIRVLTESALPSDNSLININKSFSYLG